MEDVQQLIERLGDAQCASCGLRYTKGAIRGIGYENDRWFVYVTCLGCGTQGIGVTLTPLVGGQPEARPLTIDDVLDAHELLARHGANVHGLFDAGAERVR